MKNLKEVIHSGLRKIENSGEILSLHPISGGDINEALYVRTREQEYFVKLNKNMDASFFHFEAEGLEVIRKTNTIGVPSIYCVTVDEQSNIPMLWMEWMEGKKNEYTDVLLGERLAAMHLCEGPGYGWTEHGYIGLLKQENQILPSWLSYYRDFRLMGQIQLGQSLGRISGERKHKLLKLLDRLDEWISMHPKKSVLHGDLWSGNWMTGKNGNPFLVDPSILFGDHEMEMAFTELFGGFSRRFYEAYSSVFPLSPEYKSRKELYQLYYILVHLNMFGESYGSAVDRITKKYVG